MVTLTIRFWWVLTSKHRTAWLSGALSHLTSLKFGFGRRMFGGFTQAFPAVRHSHQYQSRERLVSPTSEVGGTATCPVGGTATCPAASWIMFNNSASSSERQTVPSSKITESTPPVISFRFNEKQFKLNDAQRPEKGIHILKTEICQRFDVHCTSRWGLEAVHWGENGICVWDMLNCGIQAAKHSDRRQLLQGVSGLSVCLCVRTANGPCRKVSLDPWVMLIMGDTTAGHFYWKCNEQRRQLSCVTAIVQFGQHAVTLQKILQVSHFRIYSHHREILQYLPMNGLILTAMTCGQAHRASFLRKISLWHLHALVFLCVCVSNSIGICRMADFHGILYKGARIASQVRYL